MYVHMYPNVSVCTHTQKKNSYKFELFERVTKKILSFSWILQILLWSDLECEIGFERRKKGAKLPIALLLLRIKEKEKCCFSNQFFTLCRKAGCLQNLIEFHGCLQIRVFCDHKTLSCARGTLHGLQMYLRYTCGITSQAMSILQSLYIPRMQQMFEKYPIFWH